MLVDDALFMRNMLRSILEMEGYLVVAEAEDGEDAVARYRESRPDLVLMDILMPVRNGIEATRDIMEFDKNACVVMCSIVGQEHLIKEAREAGAYGYIRKPFTPEDVMEVLNRAIAVKFPMKKGVNRKRLAESLRGF